MRNPWPVFRGFDRFQIRFRWGRARAPPSENEIGNVIHNTFRDGHVSNVGVELEDVRGTVPSKEEAVHTVRRSTKFSTRCSQRCESSSRPL
jgi:hypothetical protein